MSHGRVAVRYTGRIPRPWPSEAWLLLAGPTSTATKVHLLLNVTVAVDSRCRIQPSALRSLRGAHGHPGASRPQRRRHPRHGDNHAARVCTPSMRGRRHRRTALAARSAASPRGRGARGTASAAPAAASRATTQHSGVGTGCSRYKILRGTFLTTAPHDGRPRPPPAGRDRLHLVVLASMATPRLLLRVEGRRRGSEPRGGCANRTWRQRARPEPPDAAEPVAPEDLAAMRRPSTATCRWPRRRPDRAGAGRPPGCCPSVPRPVTGSELVVDGGRLLARASLSGLIRPHPRSRPRCAWPVLQHMACQPPAVRRDGRARL